MDGNPQIILFDVGSASWKLNEWKQELWDKSGIGIPHGDVECNDSVIFGFLVAQYIAEFRHLAEDHCDDGAPRIVTHFHEWLAGIGLIMLRVWNVDVATVFTTHATLLGRFLCAGALDFYNNLDKVTSTSHANDKHRLSVTSIKYILPILV